MYQFGKTSLERLETCHPDLQRIANELILIMDVSILCGHRNEIDQDFAYTHGFSKAPWPQSKHNTIPSQAMDIAPWDEINKRINWHDVESFDRMLDEIVKIAERLNIKIRLGRDFTFKDMPHVEKI